GLAYTISMSGHEDETIDLDYELPDARGYLSAYDTYIQDIMTGIMWGKSMLEQSQVGALHPLKIGIFLEGFNVEDKNGKKLTVTLEVTTDDISGDDYKFRNEDTFVPCIQDSNAIIIILDSSGAISIIEHMAAAASIPLDLIDLRIDIRGSPFAYVFSKADQCQIPEIRRCGQIPTNTDVYEEITRVLAPTKAIIDFNDGTLGLFSVTETSG
ncbi:MAG: hypothetical protein ACTSXP_08050, partial [Promethearchaeota archaeon]